MVSLPTAIDRPWPERMRGAIQWPLGVSPFLLLFLLLLAVYAYTPPRWQDWNQNSRFNLTRAIVEQGTVRIDAYAGNTGDYALIDGHIYTDKAPGLSLMAVPVYVTTLGLERLGLDDLTHRIGQSGSLENTLNENGAGISEERTSIAFALYLATLITVAIPAALMAVLLALIVERVTGSRAAGIWSALIIALATPVFPYAQAFYGHVPAVACLVGALALILLRNDDQLTSRRLLGIGFLLGWAIVIEYPVALLVLPLALWAVAISGYRGTLLGTLGALPALLTLAIYDLVAFGTVMPIGYQHSALWQDQHSTGFLSITRPHFNALYGLSFSPFRGLFFFAPVLILTIPGIYLLARERHSRAVGLVATGAFMTFFLFIASSIMWWGGFAAGPRYLVPAIPLLAVPLGAAVAELNRLPALSVARRLLLGATGVLALVSVTLTWAMTFAGQNYPPDTTRRPLTDYVLPAFQNGDIARNIGMVIRFDGVSSLVPLAIMLIAGLLLIAVKTRANPAVVAS